MRRITVNSNPLNQNDDIEGSPQPPPQNSLPLCSPPPQPQPPQYQNQSPIKYPPTYHLNHQCLAGSNNGMMDQCPVNTELENWKTGLFDCMENPSNAAMTLFCPCVTFGQIAEIVDQGHTLCGTSGTLYCCVAFCSGLPCLISNPYRTKLRIQYKLVESPASDSLLHLLCDCCALCQEYRELQLRGIDPCIGWSGNKAKIQRITQQCAVMPPRRQTMSC